MSLSTSKCKQRKFCSYMSLTVALKKGDNPRPGRLATVLLTAFVEGDGRLYSSTLAGTGISEDGKFSTWRDKMIKDGWLLWSHSQIDKGKYQPGKRLVSYINREIQHREMIASRKEIDDLRFVFQERIDKKADSHRVDSLEDDMRDLRAEMHEIKDLLSELQKLSAPPPDEAKQKRTGQIADRLNALLHGN